MIRTESVGRAVPLQPREALHRVLGQGALGDLGHARADGDQYIGLLRFRGVLSTGAQEARQLSRGQVVHQSRLPPQRSGGDGDCGDGVTEVMLAIAKGALPVLPRLPPMNRGQPDEDRLGRTSLAQRLPQRHANLRPDLERMFLRCIVAAHRNRTEIIHRTAEQVALGRVQVAARRVDPERPSGPTRALPGRDRQAVEEEL